MKHKFSLKLFFYYLQGNIRYKLYYSNFASLIRKHIREQIDMRVRSMDKECHDQGQCIMCGCSTTALQMCDKSCDKPCYPAMLDKATFTNLQAGGLYVDNDNLLWAIEEDKFVLLLNLNDHELEKNKY